MLAVLKTAVNITQRDVAVLQVRAAATETHAGQRIRT
jgi:hypothetical protein